MQQFNPNQLMQQVDSRLFFQGLPHQVPFVLNVPQSAPNLAPYAGQITAIVLMTLQAKAQANPLRANLWLSCQYQNWQNGDIQRLMAMTCELTNLFTSQYHQPLEQAIANATEEACAILSVSFADRSQLSQYLGGYAQDMQYIRNRAAEYARQLQNLAYAQSQYSATGMMGVGSNPYAAPSSYGAPIAQGTNGMNGSIWSGTPTASLSSPIASGGAMVGDLPAVDLPYQSNTGPGLAAVPNMNPVSSAAPVSHGPAVYAVNPIPATSPAVPDVQAFGFDQPKPAVNQSAVPAHTSGPVSPVVPTSHPGVPAMNKQTDVRPSIDDLMGAPRRPQATPQPTPEPQPVQSSTLSKIPTRPENPHPAEWVEMEDGTIVVPAALYPELQDRIPVGYQRNVYDVSLHVLMYLIRPDGTVHETLVKRRPEMDFAEHELNRRALYTKQDAIANIDGLARPPKWDIAMNLTQHPVASLAANAVLANSIPEAQQVEGKDELEIPTVDIGERIGQFQSIDDARFKAVADAINTVIEERPYEYYAEILTRLPIQGIGFGQTLFEVRKDSYALMHEHLSAINPDRNDLGMQANTVRQTLDRYVTQEINRILQQQLSLQSWSIDSFLEDYHELIRILNDQFGEQVVECFESTARHTKNMMKNMCKGRMIAVGYRVSILSVPWSMNELSLDLNNGGALVSESQPQLHAMISNIFERAHEDKLRTDRYFIETNDAALIEVRKGLLNPQSYMLNMIEKPQVE